MDEQLPIAAVLGLSEASLEELIRHPSGNGFRLLDALSHPLRREIVRELHTADAPSLTLQDLCDGESRQIRSAGPRTVRYHLGILAAQGVLGSASEVATGRGMEPLYHSTVTADGTVSHILLETAAVDLRWDGMG